MKVLITGGAGFIGSHYADAFTERGDDVTIFDKSPPIHERNSKYIAGDLRDRESIEAAIKRCDFVIHAAGILGTHETMLSALETAETNIGGTLNVIESVKKYGNNLVNISKPNVWLNPYSITKDCTEKFCFMYVNEFDTKIAIIKLFNVYGPRQKYSGVRKAIPTWIVEALLDRPVEIYGTGSATVDLVFTQDVKAGTIAIVDQFDKCRIRRNGEIAETVYGDFPGYNEQILELGSGEEISVNDVTSALRRILGIRFDVRHVPMRRGEIDGTRLCANLSRLTKLTGYRPKVSLDDGLRETVAYYKAHPQQIVASELDA